MKKANREKAQTILITGGAGYIGRITEILLKKSGFATYTLDNFSTSQRPKTLPPGTAEIDLVDLEKLKSAWKKIPKPTAVIHFAAKALVGESVEFPESYFRNNFNAALNIAELCTENGVENLIHSSSCSIYGNAPQIPISEDARKSPESPYAATKSMCETLFSFFATKGLRTINLRYFNPAGALRDPLIGENHNPETHLIPNAVTAALQNKPFYLYGTDYPTPDKTCIRDILHIEDLAKAHLAALSFLLDKTGPYIDAFNIGSGQGTSVKEVLSHVEKLSKKSISTQKKPRRPGDSPQLVADISKAQRILDWQPEKTIEEIILSEIAWQQTGKKAL
jgi:UDP-glucose-4-epimerase GalE